MKIWQKILTGTAVTAAIGGSIYGGVEYFSADNTAIAGEIVEDIAETTAEIISLNTITDADSTEDEVALTFGISSAESEEVQAEVAFTAMNKPEKEKESTESKPATTTEQSTSGTIATTEQPAPAATTTQQAQNTTPAQTATTTNNTAPAPAATNNTAPSNTTTQNTQPAPSAATQPVPQAPAAPVHEHNWQWVVDVPASTKTVVDKEAWTENVVHGGYTDVVGVRCNGCGAKFTSITDMEQHPCGALAYGTCFVQVWVDDAWTEVVHHPAETHTETIPEQGHYQCSCGATK